MVQLCTELIAGDQNAQNATVAVCYWLQLQLNLTYSQSKPSAAPDKHMTKEAAAQALTKEKKRGEKKKDVTAITWQNLMWINWA